MAVLRFSSLNALLSSIERLRAVTPKNVITPIEKAVALTTKSLSGTRRNDQNNGPTMAIMIRMIASLRSVNLPDFRDDAVFVDVHPEDSAALHTFWNFGRANRYEFETSSVNICTQIPILPWYPLKFCWVLPKSWK
jgi:hypothetical protein